MYKKIAFALVLIVAFAISACATPTPQYASSPGMGVAQEEVQRDSVMPEAAPIAPSTGSSDGYNSYSVAQERMVITNAQLSIAVADPVASMESLRMMAAEMNGYTVSANQYLVPIASGAEVAQAEITIRVPTERFNEAMTRIKAMTDKDVINETINSQDVTAEYTDLESRLRNLEAAEEQLQNIMDEATKTEDVLAVYNNLVSVREQIEVIKGQMQYYEQSAALSSIYVNLKANESVQPITVGGWELKGVVKDAAQALVNVMKGLATAATWIVIVILPAAILILLPFFLLFLIVRAVARRNKRRQAPPAAA
jgi:hypothetical protein